MALKRWSAALVCAWILTLGAPGRAEAASSGGSLLNWISRTVAEALSVVAGNDAESGLQSGGALAIDRSVGTLVGELKEISPALHGVDLEIDVDGEFHPGFELEMSRSVVVNGPTRIALGGSVGYDPEGDVRHSLRFAYERAPSPAAPVWRPSGAGFSLAREEKSAAARTVYRVEGHVRWAGLRVAGDLRDERRDELVASSIARPIDAAQLQVVASIPDLSWAELEMRRAWSPDIDAAALVCSASDYLVRVRPLGPLEVIAGRQQASVQPASWYTTVRLNMKLGGPI